MLADTFYSDAIYPNGENMCTSALQCFLTIFSLGPRSSGSIGDVILQPSYDKDLKLYYIRYVFDVSIFFIVNLLGINILFAIIIENFSGLREKKRQQTIEDKTMCFICSLAKTTFDTNSFNFETHINYDHNIWDYIFYVYSIKKKSVTEYNGIESYIKEEIDKENIGWFPFYRTLKLDQLSDQNEIHTICNRINQSLDKVVEDNKEKII